MIIFYLLLVFVAFYIGVLYGGHDMKKAYGIPRTMGVDEFKESYIYISNVPDLVEEEDDGFNLT